MRLNALLLDLEGPGSVQQTLQENADLKNTNYESTFTKKQTK